ncbi:patatin-like phospholipase family protein [Arthrobacter sp. ISL-72]|uniref:patatin-like phospholipase family protein n=1 Tax=Arthrobacter sp. ISL-72 TaxID=2819114 RepID=UPI001BECA1A0|nr:patatin-like phospholipase family protein [Arthrobacter sp. ISL-72]MBT2595470.1 patatin-like phospholipase family protein [Arthrobacter sp. ISL-72]
MKRSLVLAGGGMRVAWQAGVVRALAEEGLHFDHVDGTSGGILTAGMLLSGVSPEDMCRNWSGVNVRDFGSALPPGDYVKGPWSLPAIGDADGLLGKVFPALGINDGEIRRRAALPGAVEGTFNVAEFTAKRCHAIDARDVDAELMAAGMSLPIFLTPLRRDGKIWTDAVWIRDANVAEALRREADEVWLIWCIGNTDYWGDGPLEQYVHMIEMSAMGALLADFDAAAAAGRDFILHVVRPENPLPLDPEFYLDRIDADTLIGMGYRDARSYLKAMTAEGLPKDASCTAMVEPPPGIRFTERLHGRAGNQGGGEEVRLTLTVTLPLDGSGAPAGLTGFIDHAPFGPRIFLAGGRVDARGESVTYRASVHAGGAWHRLAVARVFHDDPGPDAWDDTRRAHLTVGSLLDVPVTMGLGDAAALIASVEPAGVHGPADRAAVVAAVAAGGVREAFRRYR